MIGAVVLAAGRSLRMGRPKMTLPWAETTVIGQVVKVLEQASVDEILVVTGGASAEVEAALQGTSARAIFNPKFAESEMIHSLQIGLGALSAELDAALIVLGDQPQIEYKVVQVVIDVYQRSRSPIVVPSYQKRRGHPWLVANSFWGELLRLASPATLRDFLNRHLTDTSFVNVATPSVLLDLDTPEDYRRDCPQKPDS